ncbi:hypothetical protein TcasGA2_TC032965 [Tribolium castaneum]|uniref:Uncharacterized protein n=1 Tax=Tribolium castaneum TaxID=7070 RepID=A0A139WA69_TRICA|nr:hypothetical protein TcasGA2_TC032965 [Tribolium castaneum]
MSSSGHCAVVRPLVIRFSYDLREFCPSCCYVTRAGRLGLPVICSQLTDLPLFQLLGDLVTCHFCPWQC